MPQTDPPAMKENTRKKGAQTQMIQISNSGKQILRQVTYRCSYQSVTPVEGKVKRWVCIKGK